VSEEDERWRSLPDVDEGSARTLGEAALRGARWVTLSRLGIEILGFASSVVLARLITPTEFGYAAIALIVGALALGVTSMGIGAALVQMRETSAHSIEAAVALSVLLGVTAAGVTLATAPLLRDLVGSPVVDLVRLMSLSFVLAGLGAVPDAMLQRRLDFPRLSKIELTSSMAGILTSLGCALAGMNAEAIVAGALVLALTSTLMRFIAARPPWPRWHRPEIRTLVRFGLPATGASIAYTASRNVDYLIVGTRLGATEVGIYYRAYTLGVEYQAKVSQILLRIAFPVLSRASDFESLRELRRRMVRLHAVLLLPPLGLLVVVGPTLVPWLYGSVWDEAGHLVQWLAVAGMAAVIATGTGPVLLATGHPRALRNYNLSSLVVFAIVVYVAAGSGTTAIAIAVALYRVGSMLSSQYLLIQRIVGISMLDMLRNDAAPAAVGTLVLMGAAALVLHALLAEGAPTVVALGAAGVVGFAAYWGVLRIAFAETLADVTRLTRRFLPQRARAA
jgi:PST family polysaccharide transporter